MAWLVVDLPQLRFPHGREKEVNASARGWYKDGGCHHVAHWKPLEAAGRGVRVFHEDAVREREYERWRQFLRVDGDGSVALR